MSGMSNSQPRNKDLGRQGNGGEYTAPVNTMPDLQLRVAVPSAVQTLIAAYDRVSAAPHTEIYDGVPVPAGDDVRALYRQFISEAAHDAGIIEVDEDGGVDIVKDDLVFSLPVELGLGGPNFNSLKDGLVFAEHRNLTVDVTRAELESIVYG